VPSLLSQLVSSPAGAFVLLAIAAFLEVFGDACFQSAMYQSAGSKRAVWFVAGTLVLVFYSLFVNSPKWDFGKLRGRADRGEGPVPAVADASDLRWGSADRSRRDCDDGVEGMKR